MTEPQDPYRATDPPVPPAPTVASSPPTAPPGTPGVPSLPTTTPYPVGESAAWGPASYLPAPYVPPSAGEVAYPASAFETPGYAPEYVQPVYAETVYAQHVYIQQSHSGLVDPLSGRVLSDRSKIVAGLLQLLLGFVFTLGGVGRLYAGNTAVGVVQLMATLVGWTAFWCGFVSFFLTWPLWLGIWLWFVIDGFVILVGRPVDGQGRLLRG